jgi:hypothetical protein
MIDGVATAERPVGPAATVVRVREMPGEASQYE